MLRADKLGSRVRISPTRPKNDILPPNAKSTYIRLLVDDELAGNVFGTRWVSPGGNVVLWVTQLCVSSKRRNSRIATRLLQELRQKEDTYVGILSSQPFALSAVLRVFGNGLENTDLETTRKCAKDVMESCPVRYVREAKIRGSLCKNDMEDGSISCADTQFWVDHMEPLEALALIKEKRIIWPFGELPEGHEFLLLVKPQEC
jgi:hypothetical protein